MRIEPLVQPLQLTNNGELEIVFIGVGSAFSRILHNTNFLIIKGDNHVLVDFGTTGPDALPTITGLGLGDIGVILPTHSHCDHIGGIEQLALWNRYVAMPFSGKPNLSMIISEDYQEILWNMSLRGGMEWNETNQEGKTLTFTDYFTILRPKITAHQPRLRMDVTVGDIHIEIFGTNHIPEQATNAGNAFITYGVLIDGKIFYSGDTKFDRSLLDMYHPLAEWMFHDTSFIPNPVHASLDELRTLPEEIKKKMFLVHYSDVWQNQNVEEFAGLAQQGVRYIF